MVVLGLLLLLAGALAIVAALFTAEGTSALLGIDLSAMTVFFIGVAAGAAILWGFGILKYGTKRGIQARRERRKINELSQKLEAAEAERKRDPDGQ